MEDNSHNEELNVNWQRTSERFLGRGNKNSQLSLEQTPNKK